MIVFKLCKVEETKQDLGKINGGIESKSSYKQKLSSSTKKPRCGMDEYDPSTDLLFG